MIPRCSLVRSAALWCFRLLAYVVQMESFWPIVASVLGVFLVMGIGALCRHTKWLSTEADQTLANLTAKVMLPAYFISKLLSPESNHEIATAWVPPIVGFLCTGGGFLLALLFAKLLGPKLGLVSDSSQRSFALCAGIANYGYIPLPLATQFYPEAVLDLILHNVGVDLALWSIGIAIISGSGRDGWRQVAKSAPLWAVVFSLVFLATGLTLPAPILAAIDALGECAIPLGLLLSGAIIVDFLRDRQWWGRPKVILVAIGFRQILMPALMLTAGAFLLQTTTIKVVVLLQAAMPAAVFPIVLTKLYKRDIDVALRVVLWTSIAGIILVPLWLAVGGWFLGVSITAG
ncbi:Membrane transport protein [Stieleria bergensis]|uniref:Membrane transport protein n=1 Tax=Stieleria bergensis TaxID=2528025 RepID=A0A517T099_9BACT|nr:Membrane transport protein [Planctomycetes bacterium SV_7m_r]